MSERGFCGNRLPTLGVELELQLVDAGTLALRNGSDGLFADLPTALASSVRPEFHASCVEINTDVCKSVDEVGRDLEAKLRRVAGVAANRGMSLAWGGTHPFSHWKDQVVTSDPRYRTLAESYQETLLRQLTFGLHVHVGVGCADGAIRACDRIRDYLPILLALSANSPFWCGRSTGLQSYRIEVMSSLPSGGIPPFLGDWASFLALVDHLIACGLIHSPKDLWWDVRPNATLGTVEVRICDMPPGLDEVLGLAALIQCLVHVLSRDEGPSTAAFAGGQSPHASSSHGMILDQNRWLAARYGLGASLADPATRQRKSVRLLARELVDRLIPVGREIGCADQLQKLGARARGSNGAVAQLAAHSRTQALEDVVRLMVRADSSRRWPPPSLTPLHDYQPLLDPSEATR